MIVNNAQGGDNLEIKVEKSLACIEWNKDMVVAWAKQYAEQYKNIVFTDDNVESVKAVCQDLSAKHKRLEEIRLEQGRAFKAPLDQFYSDIKEVQKVMSDIRDPLWEKVKKFEEQQRQNRRVVVLQWMNEIIQSVGLREEFAKMIDVADAWTNKTAVKSKVKAEIEAKATALMAMQAAADQAEELKRQKNEMAVMMCKLQSESAGLAKPIEPKDIFGIANLSLMDLPAAITAAVTKQRDAEQAAIERAERQKAEAAEREAKRLADEAAAKAKEAERMAAAEAVRRLNEVQQEPAKEPAPQFKMTMRYFGTQAECDWLVNTLEGNGIDILVEGMERIS